MRKLFITLSLLIALSMALAACGGAQPAAEPEVVTVVETQIVEKIVEVEPEPVEGPKTVTLSFGYGDVPTLDPAIAEDTSSIQIIEETFVGLTRINEVTSATDKGMATDWTSVINDDGTETITFTLLTGIPWVRWNGEEVETVKTCDGSADRLVTAQDFAYGIERNLNPANASPYAYVWGFVLVGADDYNNGVTDDFSTVGVEVIDDATMALTFKEPAAFNSQIAGMWIGRPQPQWVIEGDDCTEARGERWTEPGFFQGYGPYTLKEWVHDSYITIVKNPFWPGTDDVPAPKVDEATWYMLDDSVAFAEYEAGNLDASPVPLADIDRVKADPVYSQEFVTLPQMCTYYYGFNTTAPVVDDVRVRRALSMAVDRQGLIDNVTKGGQQPAQWFSRPGLAGSPTMEDHPDTGIWYDPEAAKAELQSYLDETGQTADQLDLTLMFNTSSGHQAIAEAIQQMWKDTLGVDVKLVNQEWAVYLATIKGADTPQIWRLGWCLDYPDANNFIRENFDANGSSNPYTDGEPSGGAFYKNEEFFAGLAAAATEPDPVKRVDMYAALEDTLVRDDAVIIPIYWYTRVLVSKPYLDRTFGVSGNELIEKWDVLPH